jgi:hypothetical protein
MDFLQAIGHSLNSLTLDTSNVDLDSSMNALCQCCPNLVELSLGGGDLMDIRFDFSDYRASNQSLPELPSEWGDISALADDLSIPNGP